MFDVSTVALVVGLYVGILWVVALWGEGKSRKANRLSNSSLVYALSLAVYCTSWTFYGSVGKAATSGLLFLTIYIGPTLGILFWWTIQRKLIRIKNKYRITSIADFISCRYYRSQALAAIATVIALVGIVPYIALQLKAVTSTFHLISDGGGSGLSSWIHSKVGPLVVLLMATFTILFGVRRLDPTERHKGMVLALATECVVKLIAFLAAGIFVTYFLFDGFGDIFRRAGEAWSESPEAPGGSGPSFVTWTTYTLLAMSAIFFLPRQFHVSVVENSNENHVRKAQWLFPMYLLLINIFVIPIALGGLLLGNPASGADSFVLQIPLDSGARWLSLLVFIGGFSAATGMIMITSMTMSTMATNHLLLPVIEGIPFLQGLRRHLLKCRWVAVVLFVLAGYWFANTVGDSYMLVNMGMISFAAALQFAPVILGGLFWRRGNRKGAIAGLSAGFLIWFYTLMLPAFAKSGWLPEFFLEEGPLGITLLRPEQLFGLAGLDKFTHAVFWTMAGNIGCYVAVSLFTYTAREEQAWADDFVSILESESKAAPLTQPKPTIPLSGKCIIGEKLLSQYLSPEDARHGVEGCLRTLGIEGKKAISVAELAHFQSEIERVLSGSIGAAAAHHAVQASALFTKQETNELSSWYGDILADLKVTPEELRQKVDYYQEKESLMLRQAQDLEEVVERRTAELKEANRHLKEEIVERQKAEAERETMHNELVETSRRAGMAEVATSVLHNIGNVLNSINVAATHLTEMLRQSKSPKLVKALEMMKEHSDDLGAFLSADEKGKMLPEFMEQVARHIASEQAAAMKDLKFLTESIDHVKEVINTQQTFAKMGGVTQVVSLDTVVDDALRINTAGLERHRVDLTKEYEEIGPVTVDKPRVLQILVNLISNAKYAIAAASHTDRRIIVRIKKGDEGTIKVEVSDTGVGIPRENLTKIFQHGFTTKKDGHGFGLHSAGLAAAEMGGTLTAHSEGPDKGATFTFTLPLRERVPIAVPSA